MAFNITYKSSVKTDLKSIPKREIEKILDKIEKQLSLNAMQCPQLKGKFKSLRKLRVGNYRVIFTIESGTVLVLKIADRKRAYE